jgi:hypothetical protein
VPDGDQGAIDPVVVGDGDHGQYAHARVLDHLGWGIGSIAEMGV